MFFALAISAASVKSSFILNEQSTEYVFNCTDKLELEVPFAKKIFLKLWTQSTKIKASKTIISTNSTSETALEFSGKEAPYTTSVKLEQEPFILTLTCPAEENSTTVAVRATQEVPSDTTLYSLIITAIVLIGIVMVIIMFQFCTFHHRKLD